jgi:purine nucleosidase
MKHYDMPGGPVHDATVTAYLLRPSLFQGRRIHVEVDSREGMGFGQTVADWHDSLHRPANATWIIDGDARGFFDLLTEHIARLP